ncbi:HAD-IC family P-type ATPase [Novosphingobium panipatense]|jgi:magnesium-transporting ATPase (P-type)|uniref:ATPase, P-type (Transporting), HAD superfamily, subfamily IC n=2 Tax=Sphingomonadales TaxID=204457 RepID=A0A239K7T1_9SPHN|nr:ATPase, P-type (transporting), HAD superfamily, subfamily IC [Novosphingobium panipatense]SNT14526.1 ATPase, P-type (transporting), HAD superfamily, subfamily IC [Sphingomonas laterariae]
MSAPVDLEEMRWHALSSSEIARVLDVDLTGLSHGEVDRQVARFGPNALPKASRRSPLLRFLAQFNNTLIYVLLAGALAAALLDHMIDASVIVAVVIVNAIIGYIQEGKAEQALEAIQQMIAPKASVIRDGARLTIPVAEIVPGDLVLIEAGDRVPADLRLLHARRLLIDEALLTGESVAAEKHEAVLPAETVLADRQNMAFSGTLVAAGQANGIAVATGAHTQIGRISSLIQSVEVMATPLLTQIDQFARRFTWFVLAGGLALFAFAVLARSYDWVDALIAVVALAVGIVPEGLPAVITITLAIGVRRMAARNAVIRKLPAVETLGATSVICSDKTGTLTRNEMTARRIISARCTMLASGSGYVPEGHIQVVGAGDQAEAMAASMPLIRCGLLCNDASLRKVGEEWRVEGDPMEGALCALAAKAGVDPELERSEWERIDEIPFDAAHRFMATLCRGPDGAMTLFIKGAPEAIFAMTSPGDSAYWENAIAQAGSEGERVLAFGAKAMAAGTHRIAFEDVMAGVELLGLVGFIDPPRLEAREAIAECRSAGIAVKMITGDHAATALAIARQLDLADDPQVMTGLDLEKLSDEELEQAVNRISVFARTSPEHKLRIVRALQAQGNIVAMTGDGVNDAPSLKQADVGVAMGIKGTEASKEAASMVLLDDNFASIVSAVREGRTVYDNIRKVISWEIPTNGGETLAVVLAILLGFALPMSATQILWVNLILAATLGLVLAFEPTEPGAMQRRPRERGAPLLSPFLLWRVVLVSVLFAAVTLGIFFYTLDQGRGLEVARTMVVNMFIVAEIFYLFNVRYLHMTSLTWRGTVGTPAVLIAITVLILGQALFTYAPFMNAIFHSRPLTFADLALLVVAGAALMLLLEVEKHVMRRLGWFEELND